MVEVSATARTDQTKGTNNKKQRRMRMKPYETPLTEAIELRTETAIMSVTGENIQWDAPRRRGSALWDDPEDEQSYEQYF